MVCMEVQMMKMNESVCIVCECEKRMGIYLYQSFICRDCEIDMIQTETSDPKYRYYLMQLKKISRSEILF